MRRCEGAADHVQDGRPLFLGLPIHPDDVEARHPIEPVEVAAERAFSRVGVEIALMPFVFQLREERRLVIAQRRLDPVLRVQQNLFERLTCTLTSLGLYYPPAREWRQSMLLAGTILPWTSEWLLHYETWLATGVWTGGGIHPRG